VYVLIILAKSSVQIDQQLLETQVAIEKGKGVSLMLFSLTIRQVIAESVAFL
jgi:hypothetical protein